MLTGKAHEDFQEYCKKRFGVVTIWDVYTQIQHDFLMQYMDIDVKARSLSIGVLADKEHIDTITSQVSAMNKHYNDNADECLMIRERSNGDIL